MSQQRSTELVEALSAVINQHQFFACLMLDLLEVQESEHIVGTQTAMPTAYTDGKRLVVNPKFFKKLTVPERVFVLAHEVCHVILEHPRRMKRYIDLGVGPDLKPFSRYKFNCAADYVINAWLTELKVGRQPLNSLSNPHITSQALVDDIYCQLPDKEGDDENEDGSDGSGGGGWDTHVPADGATMPDKATIQRAVAQAATAQQMRGTLPGALQRIVEQICESQVTWQDYLRRTIVASTGVDAPTWTRPNRRKLAVAPHVYWPGRTGIRSGAVAVEIDTSGSISQKDLSIFMGELHGILSDVQPEQVYLMYVDAVLQGDVIEISDVSDLLDAAKKAAGGGGTDMTVVFKEIEKRQLPVESVIVLTDGQTGFGSDVGIPTIWCITDPGITAPWGETVHVKLKGAH